MSQDIDQIEIKSFYKYFETHSLDEYIEKAKTDRRYLLKKDNNEVTLLHYISGKYPDKLDLLIPFIDKELLLMKNDLKWTPLSSIFRYNPDKLNLLFHIIDKKTLSKQYNHMIPLHFIFEYKPDKVKFIVPFINKELLSKKNYFGYTPLHTICRHNADKLKFLIPLIDKDFLLIKDDYGWTPIQRICDKNPSQLYLISDFFDSKILKITVHIRTVLEYYINTTNFNEIFLLYFNRNMMSYKLDKKLLLSLEKRSNELKEAQSKICKFIIKNYFRTGGIFYNKIKDKLLAIKN